jgi:PilZ domain
MMTPEARLSSREDQHSPAAIFLLREKSGMTATGHPQPEAPSPMQERRRDERAVVRGVAIVRNRRGGLLAETADISAHGVCLTLSHALEVGSTHRLDLEIRTEEIRRTKVLGRVCFCLQGKNGYRVGLNCELSEFLSV